MRGYTGCQLGVQVCSDEVATSRAAVGISVSCYHGKRADCSSCCAGQTGAQSDRCCCTSYSGVDKNRKRTSKYWRFVVPTKTMRTHKDNATECWSKHGTYSCEAGMISLIIEGDDQNKETLAGPLTSLYLGTVRVWAHWMQAHAAFTRA